MDFGDILQQWNTQQKAANTAPKSQASHKKANAPTAEGKELRKQGYTPEQLMAKEAQQRISPMELWLRRYGTIDKDAIAESYEARSRLENREYLRTMPPEAKLDLHGLTREEAWTRLEQFTADCKRRGLRKLLIVHGKGNHSHGSDPVLGPMVRTFIEQHAALGASGHPDGRHGGTGATWVLLK